MKNSKLSTYESIAFLIILSISGIVLSTSRIIVKFTASSSLINIVYISIIALFFTFILCLLSKQFIGQDILEVSNFLGGKILKIIIGLLFLTYIFFRISILLRKMCICLQNVYYPSTNIIFIISAFCIATGIITNLKNLSNFKSNCFVVPVVLITMVLIVAGNSKNLHFENIYPLLGNGFKETFVTGLGNIFAFCGLIYLFFLPSKLEQPNKITKIALISIAISSVFLILAIASIMFLYSDTLSNTELFPLYIVVRYIEFGTFFQRLDAAFLFLCIFGFISVLCLNIFVLTDILKQITETSNDKPFIFPSLLIIFGIALSIKQNSTLEFLEGNLTKVFYIFLAFVIPFIIFGLATIKKKVTGGKN